MFPYGGGGAPSIRSPHKERWHLRNGGSGWMLLTSVALFVAVFAAALNHMSGARYLGGVVTPHAFLEPHRDTVMCILVSGIGGTEARVEDTWHADGLKPIKARGKRQGLSVQAHTAEGRCVHGSTCGHVLGMGIWSRREGASLEEDPHRPNAGTRSSP